MSQTESTDVVPFPMSPGQDEGEDRVNTQDIPINLDEMRDTDFAGRTQPNNST